MKRKWVRKRSRREKALLAMACFACLLALNMVLDVIAVFPFQARRQMEAVMEIDKMEVVWQAPSKSRGGYTNCLAVNEDVAVFTGFRFYWHSGWRYDLAILVSRDTTEPISHEYMSLGYRDGGEEHFMGYVNSDQVASIEYYFRWEDGTVKTVKIREDSYIYHDGDRYYWQVEDESLMHHPTLGWELYPIERLICALDRDGNIIYQRSM